MSSDLRIIPAAGLALLLALSLAGCTPELDPTKLTVDGGAGVLVVDAVLIVGDQLPEIRLSRTLAADVPYDWENAVEPGADVMILIDGTVAVPYYFNLFESSYAYWPDVWDPPLVTPRTTYELFVTTTAGETVHAATTTPAPLQVDRWVLVDEDTGQELRTLRTFEELGEDAYDAPENQLVYSEGLLEARFAEGGAQTVGAAGYQMALFSLDWGSDYVIDPPFFDEEDFEALDRWVSSPAFEGLDGTARLPWFGVYFEGRHRYRLLAVDKGWYEYIRSIPEVDGGLGFGGNAGDGFASPAFNIDGGIGLFGSAAVDEVGFRILPAD